jgi:hypothetical protein
VTNRLPSRKAQQIFEQRVRAITAAGVEMPQECVSLQQRLDAFQRAVGTPMRDRLVRALVDNDNSADLPLLGALAQAEASPHSDVRDAVRGAAQWHIRQAYSDHARRIYEEVAALFDDASKTLTDAVNTYDAETPSELVVAATDQQRRAWMDAQTAARKLTALLPALHAAASLACADDEIGGGVHSTGEKIRGDEAVNEEVVLLPLSVDAQGLDRAAVWRAWDADATARQDQVRRDQGFIVAVPTVPHRAVGPLAAARRPTEGLPVKRAAALSTHRASARTSLAVGVTHEHRLGPRGPYPSHRALGAAGDAAHRLLDSVAAHPEHGWRGLSAVGRRRPRHQPKEW